jgi:hypothetical protein
MIWTVALAKRQPKYYLIDRNQNKTVETYFDEGQINTALFLQREFNEKYHLHEVTEWERKEPGDIVAFKTIMREPEWTDEERKEFLIVTLVGPDLRQMEEGLLEPLYDNDKKILKARRFNLPTELEENAPCHSTVCFDKLKHRRVELTDKLRKME